MSKSVQTTTQLRLPPEQVFALFREAARQRDLPVSEDGSGLKLTARVGEILLVEENRGVRLTLSAADRTKLHVLQEVIDNSLDHVAAAADRQWSLTEPGGYPPNLAFATVESCERISPSYSRIRLADPSLARFARDGLHFRLLFPPQAHAGEWPRVGVNGRTEWPGGIGAWHRPVYTTRKIDPQEGHLEFDVFFHEGGQVSEWCRTVATGTRVALMGPGGEWYPDAGWLALFGDETALPAIARILEALPEDGVGSATILVRCREDIQDLARPRNVDLRWLLRDERETLLGALADLHLPESDRFVWFAGEGPEAVAARKALAGRGLQKSEMRVATYWAR